MSLSLGSVSLRVEVDVRYLHDSLRKAIKSFRVPDIKLSIDSVEALKEAKLFRSKVSAPVTIPVQLGLNAATKQYEEFAKAAAKSDPFKSITDSKKKLTEGKAAIAVSFDGAQLAEGLSELRRKVKEAAVAAGGTLADRLGAAARVAATRMKAALAEG